MEYFCSIYLHFIRNKCHSVKLFSPFLEIGIIEVKHKYSTKKAHKVSNYIKIEEFKLNFTSLMFRDIDLCLIFKNLINQEIIRY
jgi:hypothetical protein